MGSTQPLTASSELPFRSYSSINRYWLNNKDIEASVLGAFWLFSSSLSLTLTLVRTSRDHSYSMCLSD